MLVCSGGVRGTNIRIHEASQRQGINLMCIGIPAKKWGDTKIAERDRSVLVMCARYRSAGLTPHQRGWMDAGWTVSRLQLCNGPL